ncbi:MAG: hypothetical protein K6B28_01885 [Lachnospiraceae bacterium]|nr:hypothetical protein [Lachnospiraceae bacterium]
MRFLLKDTIRECSIVERSKSIINIHCIDEHQYEIDCKTPENAQKFLTEIFKNGYIDPGEYDIYYIDTFLYERKLVSNR